MPDRPSFPIPEDLTPETICLQIEIPNDPTWLAVISGLLFQPAEWFNWQPDDDRSGKILAHYWRDIYNNIKWGAMSCCPEILAIIFNENGDMLVTYDGTTYVPAEDTGQDPRYTSPEFPPLPDTGIPEDNKCRSATNVVNAMTDAVDTFGATLGTVGSIIALCGVIALAIVGVFAVPPSATVIVPIVIGLAQAIFSIASGTYLALFTSDVYDQLQCILYCNVGEDGTFTQSNYLAILSGIDGAGFDVNVALTFTSVMRGWVLPGLNAAARGGSLETGDCSDCDCNPCAGADNYIRFDTYGTIIGGGDNYIDMQGDVDARTGGYTAGVAAIDINDCCQITYEVLTGTITSGDFYYALCGETPNPTTFNHVGSLLGGCWAMGTKISTAPFTVRFHIDPCPPP